MARSTTFSGLTPGNYRATITTDSRSQIYEFNVNGHSDAEQNNTSQAAFDATRDLTVANLRFTPASGAQAGTLVTIQWDDTNAGNLAVAGSFNDLVTVINSTTGQTLASVSVPYDGTGRGPIGAGQSRTQQYGLNLPLGSPGVGLIQVSIQADVSNGIAEYNAAGNAETNNAAAAAFTSAGSAAPDLVVTPRRSHRPRARSSPARRWLSHGRTVTRATRRRPARGTTGSRS